MRRDALDSLLSERSLIHPHTKEHFRLREGPAYRSAMETPELWARFYDPAAIPDDDRIKRIIVPAEKVSRDLIEHLGDRLTLQLPAALFPQDEDMFRERIKQLKELGAGSVWADNIYGIKLGKDLGLRVYGGFGLNVTNSESVAFFEEAGLSAVTVSFEISMKQVTALSGNIPRGIAAYGRLPLMHYRNCPVKASIGCSRCGMNGSLTDRKDMVFPVECCERRTSTLLNCVPLHIAERVPRGLDFSLLWFTRESPEEIRTVIDDFVSYKKSSGPRTSGLYYRELL